MTLLEIADRYPGGRWTQGGSEYTVRCPCHDDNKASLGIGAGNNGGVVVKCQAGCATADVLATRQLTLADLMPDNGLNGNGHQQRAPITNSYRYDDENGNAIATKHRRADKSFAWQNAAGEWTTKGIRIPLFDLPLLLKSKPGDVIGIAEGEKDALNLQKQGLFATCNAHGASKSATPKWEQADTDWLKQHLPDRRFLIFADNDEAGIRHAEAVLSSLRSAGLSARTVPLAGLGPGEDISDWLRRHSSEEFQALLETEAVDGDDEGLWEGPDLDSAEFPEPDWLAKGLIPKAMLSMIVADPKVGKSVMAHGICIASATGGEWLGQQIPKGNALYVNWEDPVGLTRSRARKQMCDEPLPRGYFVREPPFGKSLNEMYGWLERTIQRKNIQLLVIDPLAIAARWRDEKDSYETGVVMSRLQQLAIDLQVAVIAVHHSTKSGGEWGKEVRGSGAVFGAVMSLLSIKRRADGIFDLDLINKLTGDARHSLKRHVTTLSWEITERLDAEGVPMSGIQVNKEEGVEACFRAIQADPSIEIAGIVEATGLPERTVRRHVRLLVDARRVMEAPKMNSETEGRRPRGFWAYPARAEEG